ncbi:MAG: hypothetical protein AAB649_05810 [Patescibacteria group bacterium]
MSSDTSSFKTKSEEWAHKLLGKLGYAEEAIQYPDRKNNIGKDIDFLVPDLAIEVKELMPNDFDQQEEQRMTEELRSRKMTGTFLPDRTSGFQRHVKDANAKFEKYNRLPTLLVLDIEWGQREPSLEFLINGIQQVSIPSGAVSWKGRAIRPDTANNISTVMVKTRNRLHLYHTVRLPRIGNDFMKKLRGTIPVEHLPEANIKFESRRNVIEPSRTHA